MTSRQLTVRSWQHRWLPLSTLGSRLPTSRYTDAASGPSPSPNPNPNPNPEGVSPEGASPNPNRNPSASPGASPSPRAITLLHKDPQ